MIVLMAGLPGTGKSSIAAALARLLPATILDKDRIRPALFTPSGVDYTRDQDDFCIQVMLDTAAFILTRNARQPVILDGRTCSRAYQVQQVRACADRISHHLAIIECVCDDATAQRRLDNDAATGRHPAANRTFALYQTLNATAEPIPDPKLVLNTDGGINECIGKCLSHLQEVGRTTTDSADPAVG